jgi:hypothetical protein
MLAKRFVPVQRACPHHSPLGPGWQARLPVMQSTDQDRWSLMAGAERLPEACKVAISLR